MDSIPRRPRSRNDFRIAVVCALPLEAGMIGHIFDRKWTEEGNSFTQAVGDKNAYTVGAIGKHNVVLVHLLGMGSTASAAAATALHTTFPNIEVTFVVGICGASPMHVTTQEEICLGDCIISTAVIQGDFGRRWPDHFSRKADIEDSLGGAKPEIGALLAKLQATGTPQDVRRKLGRHLLTLQGKERKARYPGAYRDRLFDANYPHEHRVGSKRCNDCVDGSTACGKSCGELGCEETKSRPRATLAEYVETQTDPIPQLHFGRYHSANTVMKSALDRDRHRDDDKVIAFEMEAAGIWPHFPTLIVKSACDYADSHKNKEWQDYAAAVAAAALKVILGYWRVVDHATGPDQYANTGSTYLGVDETILETDERIRKHYRDSGALLIKRLSGQELELEKCYINLALVDRSLRVDDKQQETSFSLESRLRLDASRVNDGISLETIFEPRKLGNDKTVDPRRIFIQGRAGIGKTTLCKKIVHEFLEGRLGSRLFDRLLWISLRILKSEGQQYGWPELVRDTFGMSSSVTEMYGNQFDSHTFLSKTLFLFDGLDEISYRWNEEDPFYRFLNKIIRGAPNVIITSRPQANAFSLQQFDLDLETIGFTTDQVSVYMRNCVENPDTVAKMENSISQRPLIRGLLRIPIQLDAFCYTWNEEIYSDVGTPEAAMLDSSDMSSPSNVVTMTTLYESIVIELCKKDLRLLGRLGPMQRVPSSKIQDDFKEELNLLGEIALQGLLNNIIEFNPRHWDRLASHLYQSDARFSKIFGSTLDRLSFLRTSDHSKDYTKRTYHFIHLTFQEFFAAKCFVEHWQQNKPLVILRFGGQADHGREKDAFAFIREEKYNPQYGIFWRFVAGVMDSKREAVRFFEQLHAEPVDLLGATHRRLVMYCMSEVLPGPGSRIHDPDGREMKLLRKGLFVEYYQTGTAKLGREAEFPETILREFLQNDLGLPYQETLSTIRQRSVVGRQTVETVKRGLAPDLPFEVQLEAAKTLWNHSIVCSEQMLAQALIVLFAARKDEDHRVRDSATRALERQSSLSITAIKLLIAALEDEDEDSDVRFYAAYMLGRQSSSCEAAVIALTVALEDDDVGVRNSAAFALRSQSSLSGAAIIALTAALKDADSHVRFNAARALTCNQSLPETAINALIAALVGKDSETLSAASDALMEQASLSEAAIKALIAALMDKDSDVRFEAACALPCEQSLPDAAVIALTVALTDEDRRVRGTVARVLGGQASLSEAVMKVLLAAFTDKDSDVQEGVIEALERRRSLSEATIELLIAALEDEDCNVRLPAAHALVDQPSLPEAAVVALTLALEDDYPSVRSAAASALGEQSSLPEAVIELLTAALTDKDSAVRYSAAYGLGQQAWLSQAATNGLITALMDEYCLVQDAAASALGRQAWTSEAAVNALIEAIKDRNSGVRSKAAASALAGQPSLSEAAVASLISLLDEGDGLVREILRKQPQFYSMIERLDEQALKRILSSWLKESKNHEVSCYLLSGSLYVWIDGVRHRLSDSPAWISQFQEVAHGLGMIHLR